MYERIVVGTDGSEGARAAVLHAAKLAERDGATLHIVCAFKYPSASAFAPEVVANIDAAAEASETLEQARAELGESPAIETHAVQGAAAQALCEVAGTVDAGLIVVGSRGMASKARFVLGSVPNGVSHHAKCDVLIVRTG